MLKKSHELPQLRYQIEPNEVNRQELINIIAVLAEYGNTW